MRGRDQQRDIERERGIEIERVGEYREYREGTKEGKKLNKGRKERKRERKKRMKERGAKRGGTKL